ncbi:MAG TPA: alpha/beta fold hydrolase [Pyrinomonadaceae bacterium]|nr:alpha/beta fold hydrolase [Pyrinomonadaceae bacterium]
MNVIILILLLACAVVGQHGHGGHNQPEKKPVWLDNGLGHVDHPVSTKNPEAQKYFNQGLAYLFAFNHEEGVNSFRHAAELDPDLAMAYWGMALGLGANYNDPANTDRFAQAYVQLQKAVSLALKASDAERAYINALAKRYSSDPKADPAKLAAAYKAAMAELAKTYPDDLDAQTLYAESMMNLRPWQLWTLDGKPAEGTLEIVAVLEGVLKRNPKHTGANHYYIHAIEASPNPERGTAAANRLMGLAPSAGHLVHMPSHIYLRTGDLDASAKSNEAAIIADRNYIQRSGNNGLYPAMYYNHNIHMLAATYAGNGNYAGSIKAGKKLADNVGPSVKAMPMLEMFMPYPIIVLARFHKWDEIMIYPKPAAEMLTTIAHWHMARGLALAERGKTADAEKELAALRETAKKIPAEAVLFTTPVSVALKVADELLAGEIALSRGDRKGAIAMMRAATASEAKVNYAEPPDWDLPIREWLGRVLLMDGQFAEAEKAYREEIARNPQSGRALFGLSEALRKQGKTSSAELVQREYERAWAGADAKLTAEHLYGTSSRSAGSGSPRSQVKLKTGITMSYVETGPADGPPLLLVHGFTDSSFSYSRVLPLIDRRFRVFAIDQRGHGDSDRPADGYEMKNFAADVVAFMDVKGIRTATIVGHSMGSFVTMQTALDAPGRVERIVLIGTASSANNAAVRGLLEEVNKLSDPVPAEFARGFQISTSSPTLPKEFLDTVVSESLKLPAYVWKKALNGILAKDFRPELKKITIPVTIFWGEKETIFLRDEQEVLTKGLPRSRLVVYKGSGHSPHWEEPERFARDLNQVLFEPKSGSVE